MKHNSPLTIICTNVPNKYSLFQNDGDFDLAKAYYDRAYKLRKNEGQLITDRLALAGSVVGLASVSHKSYLLANAASAGFAAGSLLAACRSLVVNGSSQEKQDWTK